LAKDVCFTFYDIQSQDEINVYSTDIMDALKKAHTLMDILYDEDVIIEFNDTSFQFMMYPDYRDYRGWKG